MFASMQRRRPVSLTAVAALALTMLAGVLALPAQAGHGDSPSPELVVVGQFEVDVEDLTTDVWALGNYAYLGSFADPFCSQDLTGVRIVDISDPSDPFLAAFIKDKPGTRTNDVKAAHIDTSKWSGDILVTTNEGCGLNLPKLNANPNAFNSSFARSAQGGINIYDVSDPTKPRVLKQNFLSKANGIHNTYIWEQDDSAYLIAVDDVDLRDVIVVDITNPRSPKEIARVGAPDWPGCPAAPPCFDFSEILGPSIFLHDVWVQENDGDVIAYLSYWDAGLVLLDVTDPTDPLFLGDSTYPDPDKSGLPPEGNGHVAVPTADGSLVIFGDEDTSPFSVFLNVTGAAPSPDKIGEALFGPGPAIDFFPAPSDVVSVADNFGCSGGDFAAAPGGLTDVVLIQRGVCDFSAKALNAQGAGYDAYIVYNDAARGDGLVDMAPGAGAGSVTIPGIFVGNSLGTSMAAGIPVTVDSLSAIEDGEGFMRVIDVTDPANMVQVGSFVTEFVLPPDNAAKAGTRDAHNVVVEGDRAYWAWYYNGIRVVEFDGCEAGDGFEGCTGDITEVAHFGGGDFGADEPETNFWGVYLHDHPNGNTYILGSDRNGGLWIFDNP